MSKEKNYQLKYVISFDRHDEIDDCEAFTNLFNVNLHNKLSIENGVVKFSKEDSQGCKYSINCIKENSKFFFILEFITEEIEILKKIENRITEFNNKVTGSRVVTLKNSISLYYSSMAYDQLHILENTIRSLITEIAIFKNAEQSIRYTASLKSNLKINEAVYNTNFDKLQQILFSSTGNVDLKKLSKELIRESDKDRMIDLINDSFHPSIWDKYFTKEIKNLEIDTNAYTLKQKLERLYELRNNIAHNNDFNEKKYEEFIKISKGLQVIFDEAIKHFEKNSEYFEITSEEIEQTIVESISTDTEKDTILVPASKENFNKLFLNQNKWESISIGYKNIPNIKYIAAYITKSDNEEGQYISHYAKVKRIVPSIEIPGKYSVEFEESSRELPNIIKLGNNPNLAIQSMRYTSLDDLKKAKTLQDLFS
ncbi:hypothetical protein [Carnobacterium maltaromaticum]|uniref:hypothetical protein n=1 Tax=Carnobacterium maltaromaticum TaxID=2751 RepID=UPI0012FA0199|nr:hypothetical protein [Carnobacterium maltaromaticum]